VLVESRGIRDDRFFYGDVGEDLLEKFTSYTFDFHRFPWDAIHSETMNLGCTGVGRRIGAACPYDSLAPYEGNPRYRLFGPFVP
jgi:hypothetical protein